MSTNPATTAADGSTLPPLPADHLSHPEQWATGADPATSKQKGFIKVLEGQHPESVPEGGLDIDVMGKSEASEVIEKLKSGQKADGGEDEIIEKGTSATAKNHEDAEEGENGDVGGDANGEKGGKKVGEKRKVENVEDLIGTTANKKTTNSTATTSDKKETKQQENDDDVEVEEDSDIAKDLRKTKQTTLDDTLGGTSDNKVDTDDTEEDTGTERTSKKPRLDDTEDTPSVKTPSATTTGTTNNGITNGADTAPDDTVPGDSEHLDHPENWTTGDEPATEKQKGYLKVLEKQKGVETSADSGLGKSEASEKIEELKGL
ncbi:hypothetical protein IAR55_006613 [Kwoniella newhampshirensis]|uniref:Hypervirulence associated protein TUDOR domain-containing protein n=1 Tax=Kwoniella newhampshirensis TaxID=1651941 RepID=A0AAW0YF45_9TREE